MGTRKKFTPEELKHLRANPYTLRTTADSISYTLAFKEAFWALSLQDYTGTTAFRKLGYNTEVLGFERIHNTTKRIRREAKSPEGLGEGTRGGVRLSGGTGPAAPADEAARRMKREILVLQQQMAFLKKSRSCTTGRKSSHGQRWGAIRSHPRRAGGPEQCPDSEGAV